jgi:hypothetical protein
MAPKVPGPDPVSPAVAAAASAPDDARAALVARALAHPVVVISQPMLFPWPGLFEQIRLADHYVHYADVQFSKGSFTNRVQVKTAAGSRWLTVPLHSLQLGQRIDEVLIDERRDWRRSHLDLLAQAYEQAPFRQEMLALVRRAYDERSERLDDVVRASMTVCIEYLGLDQGRVWHDAQELAVPGQGSARVLDIVRRLGGATYVTGHGARHYLDHEAFERAGVAVEYMDYRKAEFAQLHGPFTPFVSILDPIANLGRAAAGLLVSHTTHWRQFA